MTSSRSARSTLQLLERVILSEFTGAGPLTRPQLVARTGLSRAVVAGLVRQLVSSGALVEDEQYRGTGRGRPSTTYRPAATAAPVVVVRLHHHFDTTMSLVGEQGTLQTISVDEPWTADWAHWSAAVEQAFRALPTNPSEPVRHVILAVPFPVRIGHGAPPFRAQPAGEARAQGRPRPEGQPVFAPGEWLREDPSSAISRLLQCQTIMVNDTNLAALGEAYFGAARDARAAIYVSVRDGVGAGFVLGGELFTGGFGAAGELAHAQVVENGPFCPCGNRGCLATQTLDPLVVDALTSRYQHQLTFADIEELVDHQDPVAIRFFHDLGVLIAKPLATAAVLIDPDVVVMDANLGKASPPLLRGLRAELAHRCSPDVVDRLRIDQGVLPDAVLRGAVICAQRVELDEVAAPDD